MKAKFIVLTISALAIVTPPASAQLGPIRTDPFAEPDPIVYGEGYNQYGTGIPSVLQGGIPILQGLLGGGSINGAVPGILDLAKGYLPENLQQYSGIFGSVLQGALSGSGVNIEGIASAALPAILRELDASQLNPVLQTILAGNFDIQSLLQTIPSLLQLFGGNNPIFGTIGGVLGGLFGGGNSTGTGVDISEDLFQLYSSPITSAINAQVYGGPGGTNDTILSQTGAVTCIYDASCVRSNPGSYQDLYKTASGLMGVSNPNQVRGQVSMLSDNGVMPDIFSSRLTPQQNAYYTGNLTDKEISRASTEQTLSQAGQLAMKKALQAATTTGQKMAALADQCDKTSESTQDLTRCNMKIGGTTPSFLAAGLEYDAQNQIDNQFLKIAAGNTSSSVDQLNRSQDVDRSAMASRMLQNLALDTPIYSRGAKE